MRASTLCLCSAIFISNLRPAQAQVADALPIKTSVPLCLCGEKIILETGNSSNQAVRLQCLAIVNRNFTTINTDDTLSPEIFNNP